MPVNASVFNALARPARSVNDYMAEYDQADQRKQALQVNALQLMEGQQRMADGQRTRQEGETIRNALMGLGAGATDDQRIQALKGTGLPQGFSQADAMQKAIAERASKAATTGKVSAEAETEKYKLTRMRLEHGIQGLQVAQTPEHASQVFNDGVQKGYWSMQDAQRQLQTIPQDAAQFGTWKQQQLAQILAAEKQLPKLETVDVGNSKVTQAVSPLTGIPTITGRQQIMQSPDNAATTATQRRGQDMTNERSREQNQVAREANSVQRELVLQEKELKIGELRDKADARARQRDAGIASLANQLAVVDKALDHPGRTTATGGSGTLDPRNYIPGTDATNFRVVLDQINGSAFLQAFESLKGGGQITEVEGKKATDAMARLNRAQSDSEFKQSLEDLRGVMAAGYKRLSGADYVKPSGASGIAGGPKPGAVEGGYRFKGGDASKPENWEKR